MSAGFGAAFPALFGPAIAATFGSPFLAALGAAQDRGGLVARCPLGCALCAAAGSAAFAAGTPTFAASLAAPILARALAILFELVFRKSGFGRRLRRYGGCRHESEGGGNGGQRGLAEERVGFHVWLPFHSSVTPCGGLCIALYRAGRDAKLNYSVAGR